MCQVALLSSLLAVEHWRNINRDARRVCVWAASERWCLVPLDRSPMGKPFDRSPPRRGDDGFPPPDRRFGREESRYGRDAHPPPAPYGRDDFGRGGPPGGPPRDSYGGRYGRDERYVLGLPVYHVRVRKVPLCHLCGIEWPWCSWATAPRPGLLLLGFQEPMDSPECPPGFPKHLYSLDRPNPKYKVCSNSGSM